jgi:hypothetical protein
MILLLVLNSADGRCPDALRLMPDGFEENERDEEDLFGEGDVAGVFLPAGGGLRFGFEAYEREDGKSAEHIFRRA